MAIKPPTTERRAPQQEAEVRGVETPVQMRAAAEVTRVVGDKNALVDLVERSEAIDAGTAEPAPHSPAILALAKAKGVEWKAAA